MQMKSNGIQISFLLSINLPSFCFLLDRTNNFGALQNAY